MGVPTLLSKHLFSVLKVLKFSWSNEISMFQYFEKLAMESQLHLYSGDECISLKPYKWMKTSSVSLKRMNKTYMSYYRQLGINAACSIKFNIHK